MSEKSNDKLTRRTPRVFAETEQLLDLFEEQFQAMFAPDSKSAWLTKDDSGEQAG